MMTQPLFTTGQQVACIKGGPWVAIHPGTPLGASKGNVYTISDMEYWPQYDDWYLQLAECPTDCAYLQEHFVSVETASSKAVAQLLAEVFEVLPA